MTSTTVRTTPAPATVARTVTGGGAGEAPALTPAEQKAIAKEESKYHEFLVVLDDQATREVEKAFSMPVDLERRQYVVKTLIENMAKTQAPLWKVLDGLQAAGHVSERSGYQPLWIENAIVVHGDDDAETVLANAAGVAQAIRSATHTLDRPGMNVDQLAPVTDAVNGAAEALADLPIDVDTSATTAGGAKPKVDRPKISPDDPQWNLTRIGALKANADGITGKGVTVASIDTGVDVTSPYLLDKYRGFDPETGERVDTGNWYDADPAHSPTPIDEGDHGTHTTGTMVGSYGGVQTGVAPGAKFVAARGLGAHGGTDGMLLSAFQNVVAPKIPVEHSSPGAKRVVALGPDIINNSWGSDDGTSVSYQHALRNMDAMGIVNFFAAGNDGDAGRGTIGSPASSPHIITVGATDRNDKPAGFSSRGPNPLPVEGGEPVPFISMPGTEIRSTIPGGTLEAGWQGTSMATPLASGVGALVDDVALEETGYKFDTRSMKEVLKRAAQDVSEPGPDDATGYGIPMADNLRPIVKAVAQDLKLPTKFASADAGEKPAAQVTKTPKG